MSVGQFVSAKDLLISDKNGHGFEIFIDGQKLNGVLNFDLCCHGTSVVLKLEIDFNYEGTIEVQM